MNMLELLHVMSGGVIRSRGPVGEVGADVQGVRVLGAEDALVHGQQRSELVPGCGRVPGRPGPDGGAGADAQGVRVLRAEDLLPCVKDSSVEISGCGEIARPTRPS
jgi:hypothetical protein